MHSILPWYYFEGFPLKIVLVFILNEVKDLPFSQATYSQ